MKLITDIKNIGTKNILKEEDMYLEASNIQPALFLLYSMTTCLLYMLYETHVIGYIFQVINILFAIIILFHNSSGAYHKTNQITILYIVISLGIENLFLSNQSSHITFSLIHLTIGFTVGLFIINKDEDQFRLTLFCVFIVCFIILTIILKELYDNFIDLDSVYTTLDFSYHSNAFALLVFIINYDYLIKLKSSKINKRIKKIEKINNNLVDVRKKRNEKNRQRKILKKKIDKEQTEKNNRINAVAFINDVRNTKTIATQCDKVCAFYNQYFKSVQTALYLVDEKIDHTKQDTENNTTLILKSHYKDGQKKYFNASFVLGEGLIGQTFKEKEIIITDSINWHKDFEFNSFYNAYGLNFNSFPMMNEDDIIGVFMIQTNKVLTKQEIAFIKEGLLSIVNIITIKLIENKNHKMQVEFDSKNDKLLEDQEKLLIESRAFGENLKKYSTLHANYIIAKNKKDISNDTDIKIVT